MFKQLIKRHPMQTFQFWFIILMGVMTVAAFQLDLVAFGPRGENAPETGDNPRPAGDDGFAPLRTRADVLAGDVDPLAEFMTSDARPVAQLPPQQPESPPSPYYAPGEGEFVQRASAEFPGGAEARPPVVSSLNFQQEWPVREPQSFDAPPPKQSAEFNFAAEQPAAAPPGEPQPAAAPPVQQVAVAAPPALPAGPDMDEFRKVLASGDDISAHRLLSTWYWEFPQQRKEFHKEINQLAQAIYFDNARHFAEPHRVQQGETSATVAALHHLPENYLVKLNRLSGSSVSLGQSLKIIPGPFSVVVDMSRLELTVHAHGYYVTSLPIGAGQPAASLAGTYVVGEKFAGASSPALRNDPRFALGGPVLTLKQPGGMPTALAIQGVADEALIGTTQGPGCIRVNNHPQVLDAELLLDLLVPGSEVLVRE